MIIDNKHRSRFQIYFNVGFKIPVQCSSVSFEFRRSFIIMGIITIKY